jgi:hypothetical protein
MRTLCILGTLLLAAATAWTQDRCGDWQRTFKSKADCQEAARLTDEWDRACTKSERDAGIWIENLSAKDQSLFAFCKIEAAKQTTRVVLESHKSDEKVQEFWKTFRTAVLSHWEDTKDVYCMFHPSGSYLVEGDHVGAHCPADAQYNGIPNKDKMGELFTEDSTISNNVMTFFESQGCSDIRDNHDKLECMQRIVDRNKPIIDMLQSQQK